MKAVFLVKRGHPSKAFEIREVPDPIPAQGEALIEVEAFGLNFADVMARRGFYQDAPKMPCILGYDVLGRVRSAKNKSLIGKRVVAISIFGGYASLCCVDERTCIEVPLTVKQDEALALGLQFLTAWILTHEVHVAKPKEIALVHSAAGGVGIALTQMLKDASSLVIGLVSNHRKKIFAEQNGADYALIYDESDYTKEIQSITKTGKVDIVFNAMMGKTFKKDTSILNYGGKFIAYGASSIEKYSNLISLAFNLSTLNLIPYMSDSKSMIFVNLFKLGQAREDIIQRGIQGVTSLNAQNKLKPVGGGVYSVEDIAIAHTKLESRQSIGKIAVAW